MLFLVSMSGAVSVHGGEPNNDFNDVNGTKGTGTAGTGSIAVAAFFSSSTSSGAGGFAGRVLQSFQNAVNPSLRGVFSLTTATSALVPIIPCASGEIGAQGTIIAGNFTGQTVVVFSCVGSGVIGGLRIINMNSSPFTITYDGEGTGNAKVSSAPILAGAVLAANTDGSGSAGKGSVDYAEALAVTPNNSLPSGGAFVGTLAGAGAMTDVSGLFRTDAVSVSTNTCTASLSGPITAGSFLSGVVTTLVTLSTCPPTSPGPQNVTGRTTVALNGNLLFTGNLRGWLQDTGGRQAFT